MRLVKHLLIIFFLTLVPYWVISPFYELYMLPTKAAHINQVVRTAADMTIEQLKATDDFMSGELGSEYLAEGVTTDKMLMLANYGSFMVKVGLHEHVLGTTDRSTIFNKLYNTNEFRDYALSTVRVKRITPYSSMTGFSYVDVPAVFWLGTSFLGNIDPGIHITKHGMGVGDALANQVLGMYGLETLVLDLNSNEYAGYRTPINSGLTYLDETLLNRLFVNNVDVLMRSKYKDISVGLGISDNGFHSYLLDPVKAGVNSRNPVNNGVFTFLRGRQVSNENGVSMFESNNRSEVEYKVVNMYDPANESLMVYLFGPYKGSYSTKVEYLRSLGAMNIHPETNSPILEHNIVVAKVTFRADIMVPYSTPIMKFLSQYGRDESIGFLDRGRTTYEYTRLFAVS